MIDSGVLQIYLHPECKRIRGNSKNWYYFFYENVLYTTYELLPDHFRVVDWKELIDANFGQSNTDASESVECQKLSLPSVSPLKILL